MDSFALATTALLALTVAVLTLTLRRHVRLYILAFIAIPQFYVPGSPLPVAQMYALFLLAASLFDSELRIRRPTITIPISALAALTALAFILPPHPQSALNILAYYGTWACMLRYVWAERSTPRHFFGTIFCTLPWVVVESGMTAIFRARPDLESAFLHSRFAEILIGPAAPALFNGQTNNVLDPAKAGGLFVNGNVASMFLGVSAIAVFILAKHYRSRLLGSLGVVILISVVFTGSKTGIVLAVVIPIVIWGLTTTSRPGKRRLILPIALISVSASIVAPSVISDLFPSFTARGDVSLGTRGELWGTAAQLFAQHPLAGVGWDNFQTYALRSTGNAFPPHNLIIAAWANTGLLGALAVIALIALAVFEGIKTIFNMKDLAEARIAAYALAGCIWVFVHGMADNTTVYGEPKTMILITVLLAVALNSSPAAGARGGEFSDHRVTASNRVRISGEPGVTL